MTTRDLSLDVIKGWGCLAMIAAHIPVSGAGRLPDLGGLAPVLFYSVSGVTAVYQSRKRSVRQLAIFYTFFFIVGYSYAWLHRPGEYASDIMQIIAMGTMATCMLSRWLPNLSTRGWAVLALIPFAVHCVAREFNVNGAIVGFPITGFVVVPGVFPLFPWLSFFWWGAFARSCQGRALQGCTLITAVATVVSALRGGALWEKWNMSNTYYLLCLTVLFGSFGVARRLVKRHTGSLESLASGWSVFFGRHSLLFLFVHFMISDIGYRLLGSMWPRLPWYLAWPLVVVLTYMISRAALRVNTYTEAVLLWSRSFWPWAFTLGSTICMALSYALGLRPPRAWLYVIGIAVSLNYRQLNRVLASLTNRRSVRSTAGSAKSGPPGS